MGSGTKASQKDLVLKSGLMAVATKVIGTRVNLSEKVSRLTRTDQQREANGKAAFS